MQISKVINLEPTGEQPFQSQYGLLYPFRITFSDGTTGIVNAKASKGPAYSIGDMVGYDITSEYQGTNKITVDKKAAQGASQASPQPQTPNPTPSAAPQGRQATPAPPQVSRGAPEGQTIGMATKAAVDILIRNSQASALPVNLSSLASDIWEISGTIIEASEGLKSGVKPEGNTPF